MTEVAVNFLTIPVANIWVNYPFTHLHYCDSWQVVPNRDDDGKQISTARIDRQLGQKGSFLSGCHSYRGCLGVRLGSMRHCFPYYKPMISRLLEHLLTVPHTIMICVHSLLQTITIEAPPIRPVDACWRVTLLHWCNARVCLRLIVFQDAFARGDMVEVIPLAAWS